MLLKLENLKFSFLLKQPACDFGPRPARARPPGPLARQPTTGPPNQPGTARPPFPHGPHPGPRAAQAPLVIGFRFDGRPTISADQNRQAPVLPPNPNHFHFPSSLLSAHRAAAATGRPCPCRRLAGDGEERHGRHMAGVVTPQVLIVSN